MSGQIPFYSAQTNRLKELRLDAETLQTKVPFSKNESCYLSLVVLYIDSGISWLNRQEIKISAINPKDLNVNRRESFIDQGKNIVSTADEALRLIHKSQTLNLPLGTEGLIRDLFSRLSDTQTSFFLNVSSAESYSVVPLFYEGLKREIVEELEGKIPDELNKTVLVINIFDTQKKDVLRHGVFAHEAGHALLAIDPLYESTFDGFLRLLVEDFEKVIEEYISKITAPESAKEGFRAAQINTYKGWLEELFVDLIAVHALGPAAYFAMNEMTQEEWRLLAGPGEYHPPIYKRCYAMHELLSKTGFVAELPTEVQSEIKEQLNRYSQFAELDRLLSNHSYDLVNSILTAENLQKLVEFFEKAKLKGVYEAKTYHTEVPELKKYFENGIAVCELADIENKKFKPVLSQSLLNTCWLIEYEKKIGTSQLNSILNKALTNLYLKQRWAILAEKK